MTITPVITGPTMAATFEAVVRGIVARVLSVVILVVKLKINHFTKKNTIHKLN